MKKMKNKGKMKKYLVLIIGFFLISCVKKSQNHIEGNWIKGDKQKQIEIKERQFGGFGKTMIEVGQRYNELFWAGQNENWEYTKHQLEELEEAMEKGFERRPNREKNARHFMTVSIPELMKAIEKQSKPEFDESFENLRVSCNSCHKMEKLPSFHVEIPKVNTSIIRK